MYHFTIFIMNTVPQFNVNLMTSFNQTKRHQEIRAIKHLVLKYKKSLLKSNIVITQKENMSDKSYIPSSGIYLQNLPLILTSQRN